MTLALLNINLLIIQIKMNKMKKSYTAILSLFTLTAWSQDIPMQVIAAGGGYFENTSAGLSISWTLGEVAFTTLSSTDYILTQGFQQGNLFTTSVDKPTTTENDIAIYPNPVTDFVEVRVNIPNVAGKVTFELYDITGRKVMSVVKGIEQLEPIELSLSDLRTGMYLLKVTLNEGSVKRIIKVVKE